MRATGKQNIDKEEINFCLPGQRLCKIDEDLIPGSGIYMHDGYFHAAKMGTVKIKTSLYSKNMKMIYVDKPGSCVTIPCLKDVVIARIMVTTARFAKCAIIGVGDTMLDQGYRALLRKEDVRETEKDRVDIYKSFKPGDLIAARLIRQIENCFLLSTAENELGVVVAYASDIRNYRIPMVPVGWEEMQCPKSLIKEPRKVAKVMPQNVMKHKSTNAENPDLDSLLSAVLFSLESKSNI